MTTIYDKKIKLPLMKDCRVDYKHSNGHTFSILVNYMNNDEQLYFDAGVKQIKELYGDFKFSAINELPIDNAPLSFLNIAKLENVSYKY